jgi:hypothetical protein
MSIEIEIKNAGTGSTIEVEKKEKEYGEYDKWEIESAARTILEAEAIKADKEKMKYVAECLKKQFEAMNKTVGSLSELKAIAKKKSMED